MSSSSWIVFSILPALIFITDCVDGSPTTDSNDSNTNKLEEFFRSTLELVRPEMKRGSTEIGIDVMDPLDVPDYRYEQPGDLVSIRAYFTRINIPGLSTFKLDGVKINKTAQQTELKFSFPSIAAVGDYIFETMTLGVPIASATGRFRMTATDVKASGFIKLSRGSDDGRMRCQSVDLKSTEGNVELEMENLAGDNILRNVLNPRDVYNDYKPRINGRIADAIKKMLNYTLKNYSE